MQEYKELTAVIYDESGLNILRNISIRANKSCFPLHWHDRMEFLIVKSGTLDYYLDDKFIATLSTGDVTITTPRQPHKGVAGINGVVYDVIMFEVDTFLNSTPITTQFLTPLLNGQVKLLPYSKDLWDITNKIVRISGQLPMLVISHIYELFSILMETCIVSIQESNLKDQRFINVIEYINEHFTEQLSTSTLSGLFGYDESYFCRKFKRTTGLTLLRYIEVLRMDLAQKLLWSTDLEINHIAMKCGFVDICYFSHRFRKHVGQSPSSFRNSKIG